MHFLLFLPPHNCSTVLGGQEEAGSEVLQHFVQGKKMPTPKDARHSFDTIRTQSSFATAILLTENPTFSCINHNLLFYL